jgi:hypothetical protein
MTNPTGQNAPEPFGQVFDAMCHACFWEAVSREPGPMCPDCRSLLDARQASFGDVPDCLRPAHEFAALTVRH